MVVQDGEGEAVVVVVRQITEDEGVIGRPGLVGTGR